MRRYLLITGVVFGLLVVVHIWRLIEEGSHLLHDPFWVGVTAIAAGLSVWAFWLLRRGSAGSSSS